MKFFRRSFALSTKTWWMVPVMGIGVCALFLGLSASMAGIGFPLDDAWIHQTYARNLAVTGEWAFIPGQPSAGSTAPLWSFLLAAGYWINAGMPYGFTFVLGWLCLMVIAWAGQNLVWDWTGRGTVPWVGLFLAGEWHLVWAALSGMETLALGCVVLLSFYFLSKENIRWLMIGVLVGLALWIRPDGVTLLGPAFLVLGLSPQKLWTRMLRFFQFLAGFLILTLPYLYFNRQLSGSIWPNTFYAKQAEYAALLEQSIWVRVGQQFSLPLIGAGVFLLVGFCYCCIQAFRYRRWALAGMGLWFTGMALLYALRLPVTYQHGRYLMPAMPVFFILGWMGSIDLIRTIPLSRWRFILLRSWQLGTGLTWAGFLVLGARAYATDVAIVQTEMVATAKWIEQNTQPGDLIAAHDIGAIGYFSHRRLIDLAGLVSPEIIPVLRNEEALARTLDRMNVEWLVTFPGWYVELTKGKEVVFTTGGVYAPAAGGENMAVYRWK
ncbi:MAG TPA: hypothetical protein DEQ80_08550 [Anaerolinea thermolimosa]|uniref:Glycosyltransferase RgtA/B/C/D-like domain-containing protein n=1 Tax=Anaerolinea thermolimosa TaxID=229919 RepID=A0A3D1JHC4_9CHLR|nr:hypothetical protein [Anaerolinea thermolimosa]